MKISFNGFNEQIVTFEGNVQIGDIISIGNNGTVTKSPADRDFIGVCVSARNKVCGVALRGAVTVKYSGAAPTVGMCGILTAGSNMIKTAADAPKHLVLHVDTLEKEVTILL